MKLLALCLLLLSFSLLVGVRLETTWAGEKGYVPHAVAESENGEKVRRGESMSTGPGEWKKFTLQTGAEAETFYLDEKTEVKLIASDEEIPEVQLTSGRIIVKGHSDMLIRDVRVDGSGETAYTFYSWLDVLDVTQLEGTIDVLIDDISIPLPSRSFRVDTLPPHNPPQPFIFDAENSSAKAFYEWAMN
jgi:hypothetical protein